MLTDYKQAISDRGIIPINGDYYHFWMHKFLAKLNRGKAPIVVFVGETGDGKSMAALKLVEWLMELDAVEDWTKDDNLVYDVLPFLKHIYEMPIHGDGDINHAREPFIFDEGGVNFNSKDFQSKENRSIDDVIQTMRMKNCPYLFCTPDIKNLDNQIRKEVDFIVSMQRPGVALVTGISKIRNRFDASWEYKFYNYSKVFGAWTFDMPRDDLVEEYQSKERDAKEGFIKDRIDDIEEERNDGSSIDLSDI